MSDIYSTKWKTLFLRFFLRKVNKKFYTDIYSKILISVQMGLGLSLAKGNLWIYLVSVQTVNSISSRSSLCYLLRGGVTKKNRKIWEKFPKGGRGVKKTDKNSQFQFGNLKNLRGGLNFSKMSEFQLFDSVVCNITFIRNVWNSKMSQFGQRGG